MNLYQKEKDFILKITNLALFIGLVSALTMLYVNIVNCCYQEPKLTEEEYTVLYCGKEDVDHACARHYLLFMESENNQRYQYQRNVLMSIGSVVIIGITLYLLNKKKGGR